MHLIGHLLVGTELAARQASGRLSVALILLGAVTPDLVDKPSTWFGVSPFGRSIGHAPITWLLLALAARGLTPPTRRAFHFWLLGAYSHLVADLANDAVRGWLASGYVLDAWYAWPWLTPPAFYLRAAPLWPPLDASPLTPLELIAALWALASVRGARRGERGAT